MRSLNKDQPVGLLPARAQNNESQHPEVPPRNVGIRSWAGEPHTPAPSCSSSKALGPMRRLHSFSPAAKWTLLEEHW